MLSISFEGKYRNKRMPANTANSTVPVEKLATRSLWGVPGDRGEGISDLDKIFKSLQQP